MNCDGISLIRKNNNSNVSFLQLNSNYMNDDQTVNLLPSTSFIKTKSITDGKQRIIKYRFKTIKNRAIIHRKQPNQNEFSYDCLHGSCVKDFKSKIQLIGHHDRLELDCLNERRLLIKLLKAFNQSVLLLTKSKDTINKSQEYRLLIKQIIKMKKKIINKEQFLCLIEKLTGM